MFPGIGLAALGEGVAYLVICNGCAVIGGKQISPLAVPIGVEDRIGGCPQRPGGVGIFCAGEDVAGIIISPYMGIATGLVILPDELVGTVIDVAGGIAPIGFVRGRGPPPLG